MKLSDAQLTKALQAMVKETIEVEERAFTMQQYLVSKGLLDDYDRWEQENDEELMYATKEDLERLGIN